MADIGSLSPTDRLGAILQRTLPKLSPELASQLKAMITPQSLALMTLGFTAWAGAHLFGVGEAIDIVFAVVGVVSLGASAAGVAGDLVQVGNAVVNGKTDQDLDQAASHLATAITTLGVQGVQALLAKGYPTLPKVIKRPRIRPPQGGFKSVRLTWDQTLQAAFGETSYFGEMKVSGQGTRAERLLATYHEEVHQFFSLRFAPLAQFRGENRARSYVNSSLLRYIEEMFAEARAQYKVNGFPAGLRALAFPFEEDYVLLLQGGTIQPSQLRGKGFVPELMSLLGMLRLQTQTFDIWMRHSAQKKTSAQVILPAAAGGASGLPAARVTDMHVCPMFTGAVPHVGGPIAPPGCAHVLIGGKPAARQTDQAVCNGPMDMIATTAVKAVLIGGRPAARVADMTAHGGKIVQGYPSVFLNTGGSAGGGGGEGEGSGTVFA